MDSGGGNAGSSDSAKPIPAETATNSLPGCGCASASNITVRVTPTTGGQFDLQVAKTESVENLKKIISKKLKVPKERICLLHRDRQLRDGTLQENQLMDGSRLTLLPSVETGLLAQRPEQSVMQALESLNDSQVNDFLSGKAPLNLTMRLGDHMMLIQLQLSTVTPSSSRRSSPSLLTSSSRNSLASSLSSVMTGSTSATAATSKSSSPPSPKQSSPKSSSPLLLSSSSSSSASSTPVSTSTSSTPQPPPLIPLSSETRTSVSAASTTSTTTSSSRFKFSTPLSAFLPKPMETSPNSDSKEISPSTSTSSAYSSSDPAQVHPPRTTVPVSQSPLKSLEDAANLLTRNTTVGSTSSSSSSSSSSNNNHTSTSTVAAHSCSSSGALTTGSSTACKCEPPAKPTLDTRALAEASRNLTQTLKQLSSEVLTSRSDPAEDSTRSRRQGAIIESMHHHGKGVYSGTFSGTLNPALQDRFGRPKRDISTIIHILNDLLCATPQYRRHARQGHTITVEASSSNTQKQNSTTNATEKTQTNMEFMDESGSLSRENQATRGKMEHLRLIMEERRARRRARREARAAPYTTQWSAKSESVSQPATMGRDAVEPMETGEQSTGSEQQLCELNPPEPVVA